jgi:uncharacterized protein (TIGR03083 family)
MTTRWPGVRTALEAEGGVLLEALEPLPHEAFERPTRLGAWTVRDLGGHLWRGLHRVIEGLGSPPPARIDVDAVTYWRAYDPTATGPDIAERAREVARRYPDAAALVADLRRVLDEVVEACRNTPDERPVPTWGPVMRLDELLATRVLELAVHGLDLADALGREPWLTPGAASITRGILVRLLGAEPPAVQAMSDVVFFELATGRRRPGRAIRMRLGALADRLPLLA